MNNKKSTKKYNIGLDIGVTSVGWAVTDMENNLLKYSSKNMWGTRLFDEAQPAEITRNFRTARRRLRRRKERINILNSLLYEDIIKKDPDFLIKLNESSLIYEDKTIKNSKFNLFKDEEFNDAHFYHKYPTIYHLRMDLIESTEKKDIRLVYLAIHHILKYRGNFLYENQEFKTDGVAIKDEIGELIKWLSEEHNLESHFTSDEIINILKDNSKKKISKKEELIKSFNYDSSNKSLITNMIGALFGYKFTLSKIFDIDTMEKDTISFTEEIGESLDSKLNENFRIFELMQSIYSWVVLQEVLKGEKEHISKSFIQKYDKYHQDLMLLKLLYKKYISNKYRQMFRVENGNIKNYFTYTKNPSKCSKDELYKKIGDDFKEFKEYNDKDLKNMFEEMEDKTFLDKINTTDNGAIPYQLHKKELIKILENQSKYYSSLIENKQKIIDLLEFKIPYYIGPLNNRSKFAWLIKKKDEKIYPWNFEEIVDISASAEAFILKMIKKCTYLVDEYVMPKNSLLYTEYCVLNELSNIRINDKRISTNTKKLLIDELFKDSNKVTVKKFKEFLIEKQQYQEINSITGLAMPNEFMSSMKPYKDMKNIFGVIDELNYNMIEEIIRWITIFEDKKILRSKIEEKYTNITAEQINKIVKLKYSGWSNLSKKLLVGLKSYDNETIMDKLKNTKYNFMQIITKEEFGFNKKIEDMMPKIDNRITYKNICDLHGSPAIKKGIWQAIKVVNEIVKIMKHEPENIYIEFARGEEKNKQRKDSRAEQLLKIYQNIENDIEEIKNFDLSVYKELKGKSKEKEFNEKLYLYFLQNGKCLYSQKTIELSNLYTDQYEVDHIIPQSYIKDDSFSNKALVCRTENQRKKDNLLLSNEIINHNRIWWMQLKKFGLMTAKKFHNLTRTEITEEDEIKFINRQLVETRQIIKHVTNLLKNQYQNTRIFSINANASSNFRKAHNIYKIRNLNNYHHAHDAYITSIIGNFIIKNFKYGNQNAFEYTEYLRKYKSNENRIKSPYGLLISMLKSKMTNEEIKKIRNTVLNYKDCYITKKLEELTGEFYGQTMYKSYRNQIKFKTDTKADLIRLKKDKNPEYYGGYAGKDKAYYSIISYIDKKGREETELIGVPIQISYLIKNKKLTLKEYFENLGYDNCIVLKDKILKYQTYLNEYNEQMIMVSDKEIRVNKQLLISEEIQELIHLMNKPKLEEDEKEHVQSKLNFVYDYLLDKIQKEYRTFDNVWANLIKLKDNFITLEFTDKISVIKGILEMLKMGQGNLSKLGLSDRSGRMGGKRFTAKKLKEMKFIESSITGMYSKFNKYK